MVYPSVSTDKFIFQVSNVLFCTSWSKCFKYKWFSSILHQVWLKTKYNCGLLPELWCALKWLTDGDLPVVRRPPRRCPTHFCLEPSLHSQSWAKTNREATDDLINALCTNISSISKRKFNKKQNAYNNLSTVSNVTSSISKLNESSFFILKISSSDIRTTCPLCFHSCCPMHAGISSHKMTCRMKVFNFTQGEGKNSIYESQMRQLFWLV